MKVEQVQVEVDELVKGMFVCALDRPWLSTPFPFQGFVIRSEDEIQALRKYCNYVYVDVMRGVPPSEDRTQQRVWRRADSDAPPQPPPPPRRSDKDGKPAAEDADKAPDIFTRGGTEHPPSLVQARAAEKRRPATQIKAVPIRVSHDRFESPRQLQKELRKAVMIHRELSRSVGQMIDDVRVGRGLEATSVRRATDKMVDSIIRHPDALVWLGKLREKDGYAYAHSVRSSILAVAVARHMGLHEMQMHKLAMGALLCEIGKAKLPRRLLEKKDPLDDEEVHRLQDHVELGVEVLDRCTGMDDDIIEIVRTHHERFDGTGYPHGLHGDQIPLLGRIAGMIDCYDAMTSLKPYTNRVFSTAQAIDYLHGQRNHLFQDQLVDEFIQAVGLYPTGTLVELNTGETALILAQNPKQRLQPEVLLVLDQQMRPIDPPKKVNLKEYNESRTDVPVSIKRALIAGEHGLDANEILEAHTTNRWDWRKLALR